MGSPDWTAISIYVALVLIGWINIYAAVYNETHSSIFDVSQRYGMQMIWIGVSMVVALTILLVDQKYYHMLAYPLYAVAILILIAVLFVGREVNGAKAWIYIGSVALQPTEIVKFTTSLALARYMSNYSFNIHRFSHLLRVFVIIGIPVMIIFLQNDTGSALVYGSFLFMLYREGFSPWIYAVICMAVLMFIGSFILSEATLLIVLILICVIGEGVRNGHWRMKIIYLASVALATFAIYFAGELVMDGGTSFYSSLLGASLLSLVMVGVYAYRYKLRNVIYFGALFVGSILFSTVVDYTFDNILQVHQQKRILDLLGVEEDLKNWGYNVHQSKIAIGSGGFSGKGFLQGTQTKYNFVPEQSTDFIFCTVGEEWGFLGALVVLALFCVLILRLMRMGERQQEPFGRIYCYCVASIFLFHVLINVGMTIGVMPVIGIPLPFFSYGGSSLIAFTILFFVAVKLDASKRETSFF